MNILIGETNLEVTNCWVERYETGKLVMKVIVPKTDYTYEDLMNLFKINTEDMTLTKDDGTIETLSGFHYSVRVTEENNVAEDESEVETCYYCEVECLGENEYQIGRLSLQLAKQYEANVTLNGELVSTQEELSSAQNEITELQLALCDLYESMV